MLRRHAIASLFAAGAWGKDTLGGLVEGLFEGAHGGMVLLDRKSRRVIASRLPDLAAPPGSTLKPLVLQTLLERGRLRAGEGFPCPGDLRLQGRSFACTHPPAAAAMTVRTAIAYSCNCFVAHCAARFAPQDLARELDAWGIDARPATVELQALGEEGVTASPARLAAAYARLASRAAESVKAGMADAVEYGTAQRVRVAGLAIAGKTGSARNAAWFAGFTDSVIVAVLVQGRSGGADAAPVASRILEAHARGRL
jgi:cell division protein FtsI/penicillin-binding protein 2